MEESAADHRARLERRRAALLEVQNQLAHASLALQRAAHAAQVHELDTLENRLVKFVRTVALEHRNVHETAESLARKLEQLKDRSGGS